MVVIVGIQPSNIELTTQLARESKRSKDHKYRPDASSHQLLSTSNNMALSGRRGAFETQTELPHLYPGVPPLHSLTPEMRDTAAPAIRNTSPRNAYKRRRPDTTDQPQLKSENNLENVTSPDDLAQTASKRRKLNAARLSRIPQVEGNTDQEGCVPGGSTRRRLNTMEQSVIPQLEGDSGQEDSAPPSIKPRNRGKTTYSSKKVITRTRKHDDESYEEQGTSYFYSRR